MGAIWGLAACAGGAGEPTASGGVDTGSASSTSAGTTGVGTGGGSTGAGRDLGGGEPARPYALGFTPFPYDVTPEAVDFVYATLASDADLIAHHFDDGIPWPEALAGAPYPAAYMEELQQRASRSPAGHVMYLALTPISISRDGLAPYRGESGDQPLPPPWDSYEFNHPDVKAAYLNHVVRMIEIFEPDYLAIGIEVNLLAHNAPERWPAYLDLHGATYQEIKGMYPELPVMVSVTAMDLIGGYTSADVDLQRAALDELLPYTDILCLSMHLFISALLGDPVPESVFTQAFALADGPVAVCETSYPAQSFAAFGGSYAIMSSPQKQDAFFEQLLRYADMANAAFVVNFVLRDYDALWQAIGSPDDTAKLWRDTGLLDESGQPRPAWARWQGALARPYVGP